RQRFAMTISRYSQSTAIRRVVVRRMAALFVLGLLMAASPPRLHSQTADALLFFKNYFVTGDYVVAGVGLRGLGGLNGSPPGIASGNIYIDAAHGTKVPDDAEDRKSTRLNSSHDQTSYAV